MLVLWSLAFLLLFTTKAIANPACAVCTLAVGASLGIARKLGVDDSVVGVWSGAMLAVLGYWMLKWFEKKEWKFFGMEFISVWSSVAMIGFMYISHMAYSPKPILIFYIDPFLFSVILGALLFIWPSRLYEWMKKRNNNRAYFPFQKVVMPVVALAIASTYFYYYPICEGVAILDEFNPF